MISHKKGNTVPPPACSRSEYPGLPRDSTRSPKPSTPLPPPPHYPSPQSPTRHEYLSQRNHCAERWADTSGQVGGLSSYHPSLPAIACPSYIMSRRPTDGHDDAVYYDPRAHQRSSPAIPPYSVPRRPTGVRNDAVDTDHLRWSTSYPRSLVPPLSTPPAWHPAYMTMWPHHLQRPQIAY